MSRLVLRGIRGMTVASPGISSGSAAAESQANTVSHNYFRLNLGSQARPFRFRRYCDSELVGEHSRG